MIKIKLSIAGAPRDISLSKFLGVSSNKFENCEFFVNSDVNDCDLWFVLDDAAELDRTCRAAALIFLQGEAMWSPGHYADSRSWSEYLKQFDLIFTSQAFTEQNVHFAPPFLPWMIDAAHGETIFQGGTELFQKYKFATPREKQFPLSVICSTKTMTQGHRVRLQFVERLASDLGDQLHWFGTGKISVVSKWEAIAPYKNHLVLENQSDWGVYTEKLLDSYLGDAFPIYWGAPDIRSYFPSESLLTINVKDYESSLKAIREKLNSSTDDRLPLMRARELVLNDHNMFVRIARIAQRLVKDGLPEARQIELMGRKTLQDRIKSKIMRISQR